MRVPDARDRTEGQSGCPGERLWFGWQRREWMCREDLVKLIRVQESRAEKHAQLGDRETLKSGSVRLG
jgi:hypothetical protein